MATYKVLQDIEAEDKFLGPLTLKQFIFASIAAICLYISVWALTKGVWVIALVFLPVILFSGFLAWPFTRDQPTEVWLLAKIRFFFKPHRRVWDQTGQLELVTITAPKHQEQYLTNNLTQNEVKSRLKALAQTIDSRGWAVKNVNVNLYAEPSYVQAGSDRLIDVADLPQEVPATDVQASDDILDLQNNPVAAQLNQMVNASEAARREQTLQLMRKLGGNPSGKDERVVPNYWFMNQPTAKEVPLPGLTAFGAQMVDEASAHANANPTADELAVLEKIKAEEAKPKASYGHTKIVKPLKELKTKIQHGKAKDQPQATQNSSASTPDPAILGLANNNDLNVATIARQAKRELDNPGGEVVIPLR